MQYRSIRVVALLISLISSLAADLGNALAEPPSSILESQPVHFGDFSISLLPPLVAIPDVASQRQGALLVARSALAGDGFPSFNVLRFAGPWAAIHDDSARQADAMIAAYRGVGLSTVTLEQSLSSNIQGTKIPTFLLAYHHGETPMQSVVAIVSSNEDHLVLTWSAPREIDGESAESSSILKLAKEMLATATWEGPPETFNDAPVTTPTRRALAISVALLALIAVILAPRWLSQRFRKLRDRG
jgi:hypothetical protein